MPLLVAMAPLLTLLVIGLGVYEWYRKSTGDNVGSIYKEDGKYHVRLKKSIAETLEAGIGMDVVPSVSQAQLRALSQVLKEGDSFYVHWESHGKWQQAIVIFSGDAALEEAYRERGGESIGFKTPVDEVVGTAFTSVDMIASKIKVYMAPVLVVLLLLMAYNLTKQR